MAPARISAVRSSNSPLARRMYSAGKQPGADNEHDTQRPTDADDAGRGKLRRQQLGGEGGDEDEREVRDKGCSG